MKKNVNSQSPHPRCWRPFNWDAYRWAWADKKLLGVLLQFYRDLRSCRQRIMKGYCPEDLYEIDSWFLAVVPNMLEEFRYSHDGSPDILGEACTDEDGVLVNDACHEAWDAILDRMVFLFREADETTCQRENPYEAQHKKALREFRTKYGAFGAKLQTEEERAQERQSDARILHFPSELPEYADVEKKYMDGEAILKKYREQCKDEAFALFSQWFFHLWD